MEPELRQHLTRCAAAYAATRGLELVTVARLAAGDWRFFERLETGASFTARKYDQIILWFRDNWPAGVDWPQGVPVPEKVDPSTHSQGEAA